MAVTKLPKFKYSAVKSELVPVKDSDAELDIVIEDVHVDDMVSDPVAASKQVNEYKGAIT